MRRQIETAIARHRRARAPAFGARVARWYLRAFDNHNYDTSTNGERTLVERIAEAGGRCFFDVGANVGDWSLLAAEAGGEVHAFEIVPVTAATLEERLAGRPVPVNRVGLLDEPGTVTVNYYPHFSAGSSIYRYPHGDSVQLDVPVTTGDTYCAEHEVDRIDLLKIDTEGADHLVLAGLAKMLSGGRVRAIQFEYGRIAATTKFMLADFYEFLEPYGYRIGKLYPTYVDFKSYDVRDENLDGPNYVAALPDVAALLG